MLEHYHNDGVLDVEGRAAAELFIPGIEKGLVSRLDHAAYLGKELARAEQALLKGGAYVQDAASELQAPFQAVHEHSTELSACGCGSPYRDDKHA